MDRLRGRDARAPRWGVVVLALAIASSSSACKKPTGTSSSTQTSSAGTTTATNGAENQAYPAIRTPDEAVEDLEKPRPHDLPPTEAPRDNIDIQTGEQFIPGAPGAPPVAAPVDPLASSIEAARAGAMPCFKSLAPGEWAATMIVTVTPSGTVTRSEIDPGNVQDDGVLSCLRAYAASLSFAQSEGRTVNIEVRVKG